MSIPVLVLGEPGSGKSSSMRNFGKEDALVIQAIAKPLPFKSTLKVVSSRKFETVSSWLKVDRPYKVVVVDDFGYLITDAYIRYTYGKEKLRDQYEPYKIIAGEVYNMIVDLMEDGNQDRIVYLMMHVERDALGQIEPATVGKMLNEKIKLLGLFTIAIMATCDGGEYKFVTNGQPLKSPPGMFPEVMDNDLKAVDTAIRDYWGMAPLEVAQNRKKQEKEKQA